MYVPELSTNLLSVHAITESGGRVSFDKKDNNNNNTHKIIVIIIPTKIPVIIIPTKIK
jgi:hypothetical protein